MLVGVLGILKAGGTYVPIEPSTPSNRMRMIFTDARVGLVLTQLSYLQDFDSSQYATRSQTLPQWVAIDEPGFLTQSNPFSDVRPNVHPDNLAYIIYTSGSTGQPKGVGITQANFTQFVVSASIYLEVSPTDRILQFASLAFDAAIEEIFPCVISGSTLVLRTDKMIETIATFRDAVEQWQITVLDIPTAYWHELTAELSVQPFSMPGSIRLVVIGGEQARADQLVIWHQHTLPSLKLVNTYGPTEATVVTALENLFSSSILTNQEQFLPVTVGHPLENRTIYILDPYLHSTPIGVPGELYLGGQGLGRGYENLQKLTATAFIPDPFSDIPGTRLFRSGDRGRYLIDGRIELLGRMDRQVKIRGFRIELGDIETVLKQHPTVHEAVVLCREDHEAGDKQLAAYVVGAQQSPPSLLTLREFLRETLPIYMVPAIIVPLKEFPRLPSGKINRRALPAPDKATHVDDHTPIVPRTPMEDQVAKFWKELLNLSTIDVRDNFFDLGGHSLLATRLLSRIRMIFEIDLPLRLFFDYPTLEEQALAIEEHLLQAIEDLPEEFEDDLSGLSNPIDSISGEEAKALLESDQKNENQ
jgi:amino acid adenylation domain-containing protein